MYWEIMLIRYVVAGKTMGRLTVMHDEGTTS
jgi:hypothetical protein